MQASSNNTQSSLLQLSTHSHTHVLHDSNVLPIYHSLMTNALKKLLNALNQ